MVGGTSLISDKALGILKGSTPTPITATYVSLFTTNPTADHPTAHGAVEWGPSRVRVYPSSLAGIPYWSPIADFDDFSRQFTNTGGIVWNNVTLTVSPSAVVGFGIYDAATSGNLVGWGYIYDGASVVASLAVEDGEDYVFGTGRLKVRHG